MLPASGGSSALTDAPGPLLGARKPIILEFRTAAKPHFGVDYSLRGRDVIFHFWPPGDKARFPNNGTDVPIFAKLLETAFKRVLPDSADVRAQFTSQTEALILQRYSETEETMRNKGGRETIFVCVVAGQTYLNYEHMLFHRLFEIVEEVVAEYELKTGRTLSC